MSNEGYKVKDLVGDEFATQFATRFAICQSACWIHPSLSIGKNAEVFTQTKQLFWVNLVGWIENWILEISEIATLS
jgi:hypothetical protein